MINDMVYNDIMIIYNDIIIMINDNDIMYNGYGGGHF